MWDLSKRKKAILLHTLTDFRREASIVWCPDSRHFFATSHFQDLVLYEICSANDNEHRPSLKVILSLPSRGKLFENLQLSANGCILSMISNQRSVRIYHSLVGNKKSPWLHFEGNSFVEIRKRFVDAALGNVLSPGEVESLRESDVRYRDALLLENGSNRELKKEKEKAKRRELMERMTEEDVNSIYSIKPPQAERNPNRIICSRAYAELRDETFNVLWDRNMNCISHISMDPLGNYLLTMVVCTQRLDNMENVLDGFTQIETKYETVNQMVVWDLETLQCESVCIIPSNPTKLGDLQRGRQILQGSFGGFSSPQKSEGMERSNLKSKEEKKTGFAQLLTNGDGFSRAESSRFLLFGNGEGETSSKIGNQFVFCGNEEGEIYIWERKSGKRLAKLTGHKGPVNSVAWNPVDNYMFVSVSDDEKVRVWGA